MAQRILNTQFSKIFTLTIAVALLTLSFQSKANTPFITPTPPNVAGTAYYVVDFHSGDVIAERDPDMPVEPASLTKIMTGYVVFNEIQAGRIALDEMVTISKKAWRMPGSRMFIEVDKQVSVEDLIKGMVIQSGNDASVALAEHIARSEEEFAVLMNMYAEQLGMTNTHFKNATGLPDPEHLTTARDMATLTRALINDFPEFYSWYSERRFTFNGITQYNRNRLLWQDSSVDGLKTGHTSSAGYCLVASAERDDMRVISVILGTNSANQRITETQRLINYAFRFFETHRLFEEGQRLVDARVWGGKTDLAGFGIDEEIFVTVPRGQYSNLKVETELPQSIEAPLEIGQQVGTLTVSLNDEILLQKNMVALNAVEQGSFFKRAWDQLKRYIASFFSS